MTVIYNKSINSTKTFTSENMHIVPNLLLIYMANDVLKHYMESTNFSGKLDLKTT